MERGEVGRSECAVPDKHKHVRDPGPAEVLTGGVRQVGETLDRHDLITEPRKNRGLEPESGADLQRAVRLFKLQRLNHLGDQRRLSGDLKMRNGKRTILVCERGEIRRNEVGSPHDAKGVEHALVNHSLRPHLPYEVVKVRSRRHHIFHFPYHICHLSLPTTAQDAQWQMTNDKWKMI